MDFDELLKEMKKSLKKSLKQRNYFDSFYFWWILKKVFNIKRKYISAEFDQYISDHSECSICLDIPEHGIVFLQCKHMFCASCIHEWFRKGKDTCPTCQKFSYYYDQCDRDFFHRSME